MDNELHVVAGAGGFIGGYLVQRLLDEGKRVRAVDIKHAFNWWQKHDEADNWSKCDLREYSECIDALAEIHGKDAATHVYNLSCNMGGIGFIETNKAECMESVLINTNLLRAAKHYHKVQSYFYSSSACVYHAAVQRPGTSDIPLKETDAYFNGGAMPEDGYGWEKLFGERMCRHFYEDYGIPIHIARFHNVYGPHGSWRDGREKAPAAICRKIALAKLSNVESIELWGHPDTRRSFCWIGDCIDGILKLVSSNHSEPINIGSNESVTIQRLAEIVMHIADYHVATVWDSDKPKGVSNRNSDNTRIKEILDWEPTTPLATGIERTYQWIEEQVIEERKSGDKRQRTTGHYK